MSGPDVICSKCGTPARVVRFEGAIFPARAGETATLFAIIDCPHCGRREQPSTQGGLAGSTGDPTV